MEIKCVYIIKAHNFPIAYTYTATAASWWNDTSLDSLGVIECVPRDALPADVPYAGKVGVYTCAAIATLLEDYEELKNFFKEKA